MPRSRKPKTPAEATRAVRDATEALTEATAVRDAMLIEAAQVPGATLRTLADDFGVSFGRVNQLLTKRGLKPAGRITKAERERMAA